MIARFVTFCLHRRWMMFTLVVSCVHFRILRLETTRR